MAEQPASFAQDITDLGEHIKKVGGGGDYRKERSKIGEKHGRTIAGVNGALSGYLIGKTSATEYAQLKEATHGILN